MRLWPVLLLSMVTACEGQATRERKTGKVRAAVFAGTGWYPGDAAALRKQVEGYFKQAPSLELPGPPVGLISPHAGFQFSGKCAGAGYAQLRGRDIRRVIILAPSHYVTFRGGSIPEVDAYATPLGRVPLDRAACDEILKKLAIVRTIPDAHAREHSLEIQLPFLQVALKDFKLIPILLRDLRDEDYSALAKVLRDYVDHRTLVVASSDFTHYGWRYGYTPFRTNIRANIEKLDLGALELAMKLDHKGFRTYCREKRATICGRAPIAVMLEMLSPDCRGTRVSYYLSGDRNKDYSFTVSYASAVFTVGPGQVSAAGQKVLLEVARKTLQATLSNKALPTFDVTSKELAVKRGVFVTYKNRGRLRGCIGCFGSDEELWRTVRRIAVQSARSDTRFAANPITAREEPHVDITVSILSPRTRIRDPLRFILGVHGLYVKGKSRWGGVRAGTYLPQVATEAKWDKRTFITHLCEHKAGIGADAWKRPETEVFIYSAQVFGDKE